MRSNINDDGLLLLFHRPKFTGEQEVKRWWLSWRRCWLPEVFLGHHSSRIFRPSVDSSAVTLNVVAGPPPLREDALRRRERQRKRDEKSVPPQALHRNRVCDDTR